MRCLRNRPNALTAVAVFLERRWRPVLLVLGLGLGLAPEAIAIGPNAIAAAQVCAVLPQPQRLNTETWDEVIHIGALPWRPYSVILPAPETDDLTAIRRCVPDAYHSQSRLGPFVQVGSFLTRAEAEAVHRQFTAAGYSTRVIHRRGITGF